MREGRVSSGSRGEFRSLRPFAPLPSMIESLRFYSRETLLALRNRKCQCVSRSVRRRLFYFKIYVRHIPVHISSPVSSLTSHCSRKNDSRKDNNASCRFLTTLPRAPRHEFQLDRHLSFGLLNVRSLHRKVDDVIDLQRRSSLDVMALVETWHDSDSVCMSRLRSDGFIVVDEPRPRLRRDTMLTNHGGVAIVTVQTVRQTPVIFPFVPKSFEVACSTLSYRTASYSLIVIYRTGPVTPTFFDELSKLLNCVATRAHPVFLAGDLNIHIERTDDPHVSSLLNVL